MEASMRDTMKFDSTAPIKEIEAIIRNEVNKGKNGHFSYLTGYESENRMERPLEITIPSYENPVYHNNIWYIRFFIKTRDFGIFYNYTQAEINVSCLHRFDLNIGHKCKIYSSS